MHIDASDLSTAAAGVSLEIGYFLRYAASDAVSTVVRSSARISHRCLKPEPNWECVDCSKQRWWVWSPHATVSICCNQVTVDWCERRRGRMPQHCFLETSAAFLCMVISSSSVCCPVATVEEENSLSLRHLCTKYSISCPMWHGHSSKGSTWLQRSWF